LLFLQLLFLSFLSSVFAIDVANSDLAFVVAAEAVNAARLEEHNGVMFSTDNLHNMIALMRIQVLNLLSIGNRLFVTETKLPMIVHAPCINLVGIIQVK